MKFYSMPKWVVWTLVALGVLVLCLFWRLRAAMKLLDETSKKLEDARAVQSSAVDTVIRTTTAYAATTAADATATAEKTASAERAAEAKEKAKENSDALIQHVQETGSAADAFNAWDKREEFEPSVTAAVKKPKAVIAARKPRKKKELP